MMARPMHEVLQTISWRGCAVPDRTSVHVAGTLDENGFGPAVGHPVDIAVRIGQDGSPRMDSTL